MVTSKYLVKKHKDNVHTALNDLEYTCSKETPRAVGRVLNTLREAVDDKVLYVEEENSYKKYISDLVKRFENICSCNR